MPVFGNGDILSFTNYNEKLVHWDWEAGRAIVDFKYGCDFQEKCPHVRGVFLARGALEQRHWDISSSERMDIIRKYVNYSLEHWGSDNKVRKSVFAFRKERKLT